MMQYTSGDFQRYKENNKIGLELKGMSTKPTIYGLEKISIFFGYFCLLCFVFAVINKKNEKQNQRDKLRTKYIIDTQIFDA